MMIQILKKVFGLLAHKTPFQCFKVNCANGSISGVLRQAAVSEDCN